MSGEVLIGTTLISACTARTGQLSKQQDEVNLHAGAQAHFNVLSARDPAKDFVPLVLKSVSSSMGRSPFMRMGRSPFMRRPAFGTAAPISWARKLPSHTQSAESS